MDPRGRPRCLAEGHSLEWCETVLQPANGAFALGTPPVQTREFRGETKKGSEGRCSGNGRPAKRHASEWQ